MGTYSESFSLALTFKGQQIDPGGMPFCMAMSEMTYVIRCRNHRFSEAFQQDFLADPANCPVHGSNSLQDEPDPEQLDMPAFFKQVHAWSMCIPACI